MVTYQRVSLKIVASDIFKDGASMVPFSRDWHQSGTIVGKCYLSITVHIGIMVMARCQCTVSLISNSVIYHN